MYNFARRINRKTYAAGLLLSMLNIVAVAVLDAVPKINTAVDSLLAIAIMVLGVMLLVYLVAIVRQRANDIGEHPLLLTLVAVFFFPALLLLMFFPGKNTANEYGPIPDKGITLL